MLTSIDPLARISRNYVLYKNIPEWTAWKSDTETSGKCKHWIVYFVRKRLGRQMSNVYVEALEKIIGSAWCVLAADESIAESGIEWVKNILKVDKSYERMNQGVYKLSNTLPRWPKTCFELQRTVWLADQVCTSHFWYLIFSQALCKQSTLLYQTKKSAIPI